MDAETGVGFELLAPPELGVDLPGRDLANEIGLRARRRGLAAVSAIARAHAQGRVEVAAFAAAMAGRGHGQRAGLRPAEHRQKMPNASAGLFRSGGPGEPGLPLASRHRRLRHPNKPRPCSRTGGPLAMRLRIAPAAGVSGKRLQIPDHQVRIIADDLAGIEQVRRIECVLDLAENLNELPILPGQELGAGQATALRGRDCAAGFRAIS